MVFLQQDSKEGWKLRCWEALHVYRPWSCLCDCPAPYKWVLGKKPRCYLSLVAMWLGISKKECYKSCETQKHRCCWVEQGLSHASAQSTICPHFQPQLQLPAGPRSRSVRRKGQVQSAPLLRKMTQPLASSRVRSFLTSWLCLDPRD